MPSNPPHGRDLTPAQALIFCRAAQLGVACGLTHRYEWLVNALRAPVSYETIGVYTEELYEAFLMFEKGTAGDPYEDEELSAMDLPGFISRINAWYARGENMPNRVCNCADYDSYCKHCDPEKAAAMEPDWEGECDVWS